MEPNISIELRFPIEPVSKGRPRVTRFGTYTPPKTRNFEKTIKVLAMKQFKRIAFDGPLIVEFFFSFIKPKSSKRKNHTVRPDLSNLVKGVEDALNGVVWKDDSQIIEMFMKKQYSESNGIMVRITDFKPE